MDVNVDTTGGAKRLGPVGGSLNGMPLYSQDGNGENQLPCTTPCEVVTVQFVVVDATAGATKAMRANISIMMTVVP